MPRNGSSVYSLPAGNPVIPGTIIATTWANTTLTDIATALTNSLSTDGSTASVSLAGKTMSGGTFSGPSVTGVLTLTGGQIGFPAVQVPSAGANVLDDYEEGTWTPSFTFAAPGDQNIAYSARVGDYTKIGDVVHLSYGLATSTFLYTTASGQFRVTGLPFQSKSGLSYCGSFGVLTGFVIGAINSFIEGSIPSNTAQIDFGINNINTGVFGAIVASSNVPSGTQQSQNFSIAYKAA